MKNVLILVDIMLRNKAKKMENVFFSLSDRKFFTPLSYNMQKTDIVSIRKTNFYANILKTSALKSVKSKNIQFIENILEHTICIYGI